MRTFYIDTACDDMTNTLLAIDALLLHFDNDIDSIEREMKNSDNPLLHQAASWRVEFNHDAVLMLIAGDRYSESLDVYMAAIISFQPETVRDVMCRVFTRMHLQNREICRNIFQWPHLMKALQLKKPFPDLQYYINVFLCSTDIVDCSRVFVNEDVLVTGYSGGEPVDEPEDLPPRKFVDIDVDVE